MKIAGMDINIVESGALGPTEMLVHSGGFIYAWDLAKGVDTCVTAKLHKDGTIEIIDITHGGELRGDEQ